MALINCKECKKEISDQADKCPNCGFDIKKENGKKAVNGCAWIFAALAAIIFILVLTDKNSESSNQNSDNQNLEAYVYSQQIVEEQLKSPASADFPTFSDALVNKAGDIYTINSYVDSQNSFGANLRSQYTCQLRYENRLFFLIDLKIN
jgi:hypothetical protein